VDKLIIIEIPENFQISYKIARCCLTSWLVKCYIKGVKVALALTGFHNFGGCMVRKGLVVLAVLGLCGMAFASYSPATGIVPIVPPRSPEMISTGIVPIVPPRGLETGIVPIVPPRGLETGIVPIVPPRGLATGIVPIVPPRSVATGIVPIVPPR
jgi:hypothetical protein